MVLGRLLPFFCQKKRTIMSTSDISHNARYEFLGNLQKLRRSQPRMRRRDLSTSRRSIRALVVGTPRTALG